MICKRACANLAGAGRWRAMHPCPPRAVAAWHAGRLERDGAAATEAPGDYFQSTHAGRPLTGTGRELVIAGAPDGTAACDPRAQDGARRGSRGLSHDAIRRVAR